jgi:hypothetical protein
MCGPFRFDTILQEFYMWVCQNCCAIFDLTKKDQSFLWTPVYERAFDTLKFKLIEGPILIRLDFQGPFILDVDWSIKGIGSVIS